MKVSTALYSATDTLQAAGIANPRREAASLLSFALRKDSAFLIAHPEYDLSDNEFDDFEAILNRRANREPLQYIVGHQEFYGLDFGVTPDVLIPRPETEILVESAIEILSALETPQFCEIGVGSGCISVSILHEVAGATAVGVDVSEQALAVARRNARRHGVDKRFKIDRSDVFEHVDGRFDLIVSNPPYIPAKDIPSLQQEVRDFEPHSALDGGKDGLDIVRRIIAGSPGLLEPGGSLLIEIGFDEAEVAAALLDGGIWADTEFLPDLQGIARILKTRLRSERAV